MSLEEIEGERERERERYFRGEGESKFEMSVVYKDLLIRIRCFLIKQTATELEVGRYVYNLY